MLTKQKMLKIIEKAIAGVNIGFLVSYDRQILVSYDGQNWMLQYNDPLEIWICKSEWLKN